MPARCLRCPRPPRAAALALLVCALLVASLGPVAPAHAADAAAQATTEPVAIDAWLVLGPAATPLPAFHDAEHHGTSAADLLDGAGLVGQAPWPAAGATVSLPGGGSASWRALPTADGALDLAAVTAGTGSPSAPAAETPRRAWLATRLDVSRFVEPTLSLVSAHPLRVWLDGEQVADKGSDAPAGSGDEAGDEAGDESEVGRAEATLTLAPGPHLLLVQVVYDPALAASGWRVDAELSGFTEEASEENGTGGLLAAPALTLSTGSIHRLSLGDLLDAPSVEDVTVSADGSLVALTLARPAVPSADREGWIEIRHAADGSLERSFRGAGGGPSTFDWAPAGHRYLYSSGEETTTLWVGDLDTGVSVPLISDIQRFGGAMWSPDGSFVVYSASEEEAENDTGFKRLRTLEDRWPGWRRRGSLYQVRVPASLDPRAELPAHPVVRRLTAGEKTTTLLDIAPDGSRLLFSRTELLAERPFDVEHLFELSLDPAADGAGSGDLVPREVVALPWFGGASYAPDGRRLLISGSPSTFGSLGDALPEGETPNDYDGQAYLYDLATDDVEALTLDYDPAIGGAAWSPDGDAIYFQTVDGPFIRIVRYRLADGSFTPLATGVDSVGGMELSRDGSRLVYLGSSADAPGRVLSLAVGASGNAGEASTVYFPGAERFDQVEIGQIEDFSFTSSSGAEIVGRVHYPPGFDPATASAASLPAIVYYYGGTVPVERSFGGRYPFNLWAAHGYAIYVLQPSGAIGFGQELSARHVNDWGKVAGQEIIEGTQAFLAAHPFVDPERVGCGGASYGGFMTMYLVSHTDIFRTAIAHAGISSLASYWGEGWWGFLYSGVASAGSYPWNNRDLYVEQSPLFSADKIHTPLLLLHGTADTNVPIGESLQLFTALKILDREVELVTIAGENHHILDYPKRKRWMETILAWYDRELKDQPGWWEHLYPAEDGP